MPMSPWEFESINADARIRHYEPIFNKLKWEIIDSEEWVLRYLTEAKLTAPDDLLESLKIAATYSSETPPVMRALRADAKTLEEKDAYNQGKSEWLEAHTKELIMAIQKLRQWILTNYQSDRASSPLQLSFEREKARYEALQKEISDSQ